MQFGYALPVLTASGEVIKKPLPGEGKPNVGQNDENSNSIGLLYEFGKFRMADFADLLQTL